MAVVSIPVPLLHDDGELTDWQRIALKVMLAMLVILLIAIIVEAIRYNRGK